MPHSIIESMECGTALLLHTLCGMHGGGKNVFENRLMKRAVLRVAQVDTFTDRRRGARGYAGLVAGS